LEVKTVSQLKDVRQHRRSIDPRLDLGDAGFGVFDREAKLALLIFVGRAERRFVGFVESIERPLRFKCVVVHDVELDSIERRSGRRGIQPASRQMLLAQHEGGQHHLWACPRIVGAKGQPEQVGPQHLDLEALGDVRKELPLVNVWRARVRGAPHDLREERPGLKKLHQHPRLLGGRRDERRETRVAGTDRGELLRLTLGPDGRVGFVRGRVFDDGQGAARTPGEREDSEDHPAVPPGRV